MNIRLNATFEQLVVKAHTPTKLIMILGKGCEGYAEDLKRLEGEDLTVEISPDNPIAQQLSMEITGTSGRKKAS